MSNVIQATVLIRGTRPMLIHHFSPDAIPLERREKSGVAGNDPEEWKRTVLITDNRQIYVRGVKQPTTKARNVRYRVALSPSWQSQFSILWDKTIISREEMHSIIIHSGQFVGLGDGRTIGFGRYTVEEFDLHGEEVGIRDATSSAT